MNASTRIEGTALAVGAVGLWLAVGPPFLFEAPFADFWNDLLVGVALAALAVYTYVRSGRRSSRWSAATAGAFGAWLVVGAVLWQTSRFLHWNDVVAGVFVLVTGGYAAYEAHTTYESESDSGSDSESDGAGDSADDSGSGGSGGSGGSDDGSESDGGDPDDGDGGDSADSSDGENDDEGEKDGA